MATKLREVVGVFKRLRWTKPHNHFHRHNNRFAKCDCIFVGEWFGR